MSYYSSHPAWEATKLGRELALAFDDFRDMSIFLVIKTIQIWKTLEVEKLNPRSESVTCRWISSSTEVTSSSPTDSETTLKGENLEYGVIALRTPGYIHEKYKKGYPPGFLFGRRTRHGRFADVWFGGGISSMSRAEFVLGSKNGCCVIQSLYSDLKIHGDILIRSGQAAFALNHHIANPVNWESGRENESFVFNFELYCREIGEIKLSRPLHSLARSSRASVSSFTQTEGSDALRAEPMDIDQQLYIYEHIKFPGRMRQYLCLNPWTCRYAIAETYLVEDLPVLQDRLQMLKKIQKREFFLLPEDISVQGKFAYMLTPLSQEVVPVVDCEEITLDSARRLLYRLLKIIFTLHHEGLYSTDINSSSIYFPDANYDAERVILGAFSSISTDEKDAFEDCFQIFKTIRSMISRDVPYSWLGNDLLDDLYRRSPVDDQSWNVDVISLCRYLNLNSDQSNMFWSTIDVQKEIDIRYETFNQTSNLNKEDIMNYLYTDAFYQTSKHDGDPITAFQRAAAALSSLVQDDKWVSVTDYHLFRNHMDKRHKCRIGDALAWKLPGFRIDFSSKSPISMKVTLSIPFYPKYGLVSFSYLRAFRPLSFDHSRLNHILANSYEIRGASTLGGIYMHSNFMEKVSQSFNFHYDTSQVMREEKAIYRFSSPNWYILAPHKSTNLFPVERSTGIVSLPAGQVPLKHFLDRYFDKESVSQAMIEHTLESVVLPTPLRNQTSHSCHGSMNQSSEKSVSFRFHKREAARPDPHMGDVAFGSIAERRNVRVAEWVEGTGKRRKRSKADIRPSVFVNSTTATLLSTMPTPTAQYLHSISGSDSSGAVDLPMSQVSLPKASNPAEAEHSQPEVRLASRSGETTSKIADEHLAEESDSSSRSESSHTPWRPWNPSLVPDLFGTRDQGAKGG